MSNYIGLEKMNIFVEKFKDLKNYSNNNNIPIIETLKGEYGKYYTILKLLENDIKILNEDIEYWDKNSKIKVDIKIGDIKIEVKTSDYNMLTNLNENQIKNTNYHVILLMDSDTYEVKDEIIIKSDRLKEVLNRVGKSGQRKKGGPFIGIYSDEALYNKRIDKNSFLN